MDFATRNWFKYVNGDIRRLLTETATEDLRKLSDFNGEEGHNIAFGVLEQLVEIYGDKNDKKISKILKTAVNTIKNRPIGKWQKSHSTALKKLNKCGVLKEDLNRTQAIFANALTEATASFETSEDVSECGCKDKKKPRKKVIKVDLEEEQILNIDKLINKDAEQLTELTEKSAEMIMSWFGGDYSKLSFNELFDGKLRIMVPLVSEEAKTLHKIVKLLHKEGWMLPEDSIDAAYHRRKFPTRIVKQKLRRRVGELPDDFGVPSEDNPDPREIEEYEEEREIADLSLEKTRTITIPKGPRAGETITKKDETTMSRAILKNKSFPQDLKDWWQKNQTRYTKGKQWKQIEAAFFNPTKKPSEMLAVISRHPLDVLRMSDISDITSCHSEGASHYNCAIAEAKGHGLIAYMVTPEDYKKLMSGKATRTEHIDIKRFKLSLTDRLLNSEGIYQNTESRRTHPNPENQKQKYWKTDDSGRLHFQEEIYAKDYFIPKYKEEFEKMGFGPEWFTIENVATAAKAAIRGGDRSEYEIAPPLTLQYDDEDDYYGSEQEQYDRAKKLWDQKEEATTWLKQYFEKFPKVAKSITILNGDKQHDNVDNLIDFIQSDERGRGFGRLPVSVRKHMNDEAFIMAAQAEARGENFSINGLNRQPPQPPAEPEDKKITDISDFDDIEIFKDKNRDVLGIGAQARVRLRKFVDEATGNEFVSPERRTYGAPVVGFLGAVTNWAFNEQKDMFIDDNGDIELPEFYDLTRYGGSYEDTKDGEVLNNFFDSGDIPPKYDDFRNVNSDSEDEDADQLEEWEEEVQEYADAANQSYEHCSIYAEVTDHGDGLYISASGNMVVEIELTGWADFKKENYGFYRIEWNEGRTDFELVDGPIIPFSYGGDYSIRRWFSNIVEHEYVNVEWSLSKRNGKVYLDIDYSIECDDCGEPNDVDHFADYIRDDWDNKYAEIAENIRREFVDQEVIEPNAFDKKAASEEHTEWAEALKHFTYIGPDGDGEMLFSLKNHDGTERYQMTNVVMPAKWFIRKGQELEATDLTALLGGQPKPKRADTPARVDHSYAAAKTLRNELERMEAEANAYAARQVNIDFGDPKYDEPEDSFGIDFAKDLTLRTYLVPYERITDRMKAKVEGTKDQYLGFGMSISVHSVDTEEEIEGAFKFIEYIDKNFMIVMSAFETLYREAIEEWIAKKEKAEAAAVSKGTASIIINALDMYSRGFDDVPVNDPRFNPRANTAKALILWFSESWDEMNKLERRILINQFLRPVQQGSLTRVMPDATDNNSPQHWTDYIKGAHREAGAPFTVTNAYRWQGPSYGKIFDSYADPHSERYDYMEGIEALRGESPSSDVVSKAVNDQGLNPVEVAAQAHRAANNIEEQIFRIDALLNEKESPIDLRIYKTRLGCAIDTKVGGAEMEIETQVRGIDGVTTVRSIADSKRPLTATTNYVVFELKFELMGSSSRKEYREAILFPGLRRIPGLNIVDWTSIHRTNVRGTVRTVRENLLHEFNVTNLGGAAGATSGHAASSPMATPRRSLDRALQDWTQGGVQLYDTFSDTTNMAYSVMLPVEELWTYCSRIYRGDKRDFDGRYRHFIADGAQSPVFVALGQNGRIKITGNEDLIWFAKKAGLKDLPVFISYQKQA